MEAEESGRENGLTGVEKHDPRCCHMRPRVAWAQEDPTKKRPRRWVQCSLADCDMVGQGVVGSPKGMMGLPEETHGLALAAWRHAVCQQWLGPRH